MSVLKDFAQRLHLPHVALEIPPHRQRWGNILSELFHLRKITASHGCPSAARLAIVYFLFLLLPVDVFNLQNQSREGKLAFTLAAAVHISATSECSQKLTAGRRNITILDLVITEPDLFCPLEGHRQSGRYFGFLGRCMCVCLSVRPVTKWPGSGPRTCGWSPLT